MKKYFLSSLLLALCSFMASAQIQRGNVLIGADLGSFDISLNEGGNFTMKIDPKAAWFIKDNLALGGYLKFDLQTAKGAGTSTAYGVGLLGRYYINDPKINVLRHSRFLGKLPQASRVITHILAAIQTVWGWALDPGLLTL